MTERPQIIVANKMDMPEAAENLAAFKEKLTDDHPVFPISAFTKEGLRDLLFAIADVIEKTPEFPLIEEVEEDTDVHRVIYRHEEDKINLRLLGMTMEPLSFR